MKAYYTWTGGEQFKNTEDHPGANSDGSTAAGAYQILLGSWTDPHTGAKFRKRYDIKDFSPMSQDRFTVATLKDKSTVKALDLIVEGDFEDAFTKMANEWRFLPGLKTQSKVKMNDILNEVKPAIAQELNNNSEIATPQGQLLNGFGNVPLKK